MGWKSTPILDPRVHELQGKTSTNEGSSTRDITPVSTGQLSRQSGRADLTPHPRVMNSNLVLQGLSGASYDGANSHVEERDNHSNSTVWIRWPGTSEPQKYKALVDTPVVYPNTIQGHSVFVLLE